MRQTFFTGAASAALISSITIAVPIHFNNGVGDALLGPVDTSSSLLAETEVTSTTDMTSHDYAPALAAKRSGFRQVDAKGGRQEFGVLAQLMADVLASDAKKKGTVYNLAQRLTGGPATLAQTRARASLFESCCGSTQGDREKAYEVSKRQQTEADKMFEELTNDKEADYSVNQVIARMANKKPVPVDQDQIIKAFKAYYINDPAMQETAEKMVHDVYDDSIADPKKYGIPDAEQMRANKIFEELKDDKTAEKTDDDTVIARMANTSPKITREQIIEAHVAYYKMEKFGLDIATKSVDRVYIDSINDPYKYGIDRYHQW